jgi:hypothetical protein
MNKETSSINFTPLRVGTGVEELTGSMTFYKQQGKNSWIGWSADTPDPTQINKKRQEFLTQVEKV